jgi:transcriptional regulator with XRE-family HTH domain
MLSAIAAPTLAASAYIVRQRQQAFTTALPTAEAISGLFTNVNESLFSNYSEIVEKVQKIAKRSGVSIEELSKAVEMSIPGLEGQTPEVLQNRAEIFAKLKKLEHLQPEQFAEIANVADIAGEDLARISQMYNVLTDNVKTGTDQVLMQLRRLADDFGYDLPSLFATVEAVSKQLPDPRETTQVIREGLQDLKAYNDALVKYYAEVNDLMREGLSQQEALQIATPPEMPGEKGQLLQSLFYSQNFADLYQKYAAIKPEDLNKSATALEKLPSQQLVDFFAKQKESIKAGMYNYISEKGLEGLEKTYASINKLVTLYFNKDLQPFVKPLFISPETGTPTFLTAILTTLQPTFDTIKNIESGINRLVEISSFVSTYLSEFFENVKPKNWGKDVVDLGKLLYHTVF